MATDYDAFAEAYTRENESSFLNAYYERPAMLALAGDVQGLRVLDVGCGSGLLSAALRDRGAIVTGFDASAGMIDHARDRLGDGADLHVSDLAQPLPFPDAAFDVAVLSLVLHYLEDWVTPLRELRRALRPGGRLVLSVPHPSVYTFNYPDADYFATTEYSEEFTFAGHHNVLTYWHRPLHAMSEAFAEAGFHITLISEPDYDRNAPADVIEPGPGEQKRFLCFLFFVLQPN